jgi:MOSC domain-containing protein
VISVCALSVTPVKGTRLLPVESVDLDVAGAVGDREFFVVDVAGRMVNAKQVGELQTVVASFDGRRLTFELPDGDRVAADVSYDGIVEAQFFSRVVSGRLVAGPWAQALSEHVGQPVRLVHAAGSVDRGARGAVSLISRASLAQLALVGGVEEVDPRRFRMLIEIEGVDAHEEDDWVGCTALVGSALIRWGGHVGRCLITSRDPDSGAIDLPTLDVLRQYRGSAETTEPLPFGIYGAVLEPGRVRVGDAVELVSGA